MQKTGAQMNRVPDTQVADDAITTPHGGQVTPLQHVNVGTATIDMTATAYPGRSGANATTSSKIFR